MRKGMDCSRVLICILLALLVLEGFLPKLHKLEDAENDEQDSSVNTLVDIVNQSPRAVRARSKQQWLQAFSDNATVQDPTGSQTHQGLSQLAFFHQALVAPHKIRFDIKRDFVDLDANQVTRLADIHITFYYNALGLGSVQPAHLMYEVDPAQRKITSLRANWEVSQSIALGNSLLEKTAALVLVSTGFGPALLTYGIGFMMEYLQSFLIAPLRSGGKELVHELLRVKSRSEFLNLFEEGAQVQLGSKFFPPAVLYDDLWAGHEIRAVRASSTSGLRTGLWFEKRLENGTRWTQGVLHFESEKRQGYFSQPKIHSLYVFHEE